MSDGSDELEASFRRRNTGGLVSVAAAAIAVLGVGAYILMQGGKGELDEPHRLILVSDQYVSYPDLVEPWGFEALQGTVAAWERQAIDDLQEPELEGLGAAARFADEYGYGYLVVENPADYDWSSLDIELPALEPHQRFAVLAIGDLAHEGGLTFSETGPPGLESRDHRLLTALFAQPRLAETMAPPEDAPIELTVLAGRVEWAVHRLEAMAETEKTISAIQEDVDHLLGEAERGDATPELLGPTMSSVKAWALADGGVLLVMRDGRLITRDGRAGDIVLDETRRFRYLPPGAAPDTPPEDCTSLAGGSLTGGVITRMAVGGDAVLFDNAGQVDVWTLDPKGRCAFTHAGQAPKLPTDEKLGTPAGNGKVARIGETDEGTPALIVVDAASGERTVAIDGGVDHQLRFPVWIDEHRVAARANDGIRDGLLIADLRRPDIVLAIEAQASVGTVGMGPVATVPGHDGPARLLMATERPRKLFELGLTGSYDELFEQAAAARDASAEPDETDTTEETDEVLEIIDPSLVARPGTFMFPISAESMQRRSLTTRGSIMDPVVSADGKTVAFAIAGVDEKELQDEDDEIGVISLEDGREGTGPGSLPALRIMTLNALFDHDPSLSPDGSRLVFHTRYPIARTDPEWKLTAGRVLDVPR